MASDQEIQKARTFLFAKPPTDAEAPAKDADWFRTKMRMFLNAHRYSRSSLTPVQLYLSPGQEFSEYLTPWEREWSVLARSYENGFTPIVDEKGAVIAHRGTIQSIGNSAALIATYEDLLYAAPNETLSKTNFSTPGQVDDWELNHDELSQMLKNGAEVYVHGRKKTVPPDWRRFDCTAETKFVVFVSIDGRVYDVQSANTGFLEDGYSFLDYLWVGQILARLGVKIGTRFVKALIRKAMTKAEARLLLAGPTRELAKSSAVRLAGKTSPGMAVSKSGVLPVKHLGRRTLIMGEDMAEIESAMTRSHSVSGFYDVVIHGDEDGFHILLKTLPNGKEVWREVSVRELADAIRPHLAPGDKIRLLACNVGRGEGRPAQQLADSLERTVMAPNRSLPSVPARTNGARLRSFVPREHGTFREFTPFAPEPQRGFAKLAGKGVNTNEFQGEIRRAK
jgi:hypothetical protein